MLCSQTRAATLQCTTFGATNIISSVSTRGLALINCRYHQHQSLHFSSPHAASAIDASSSAATQGLTPTACSNLIIIVVAVPSSHVALAPCLCSVLAEFGAQQHVECLSQHPLLLFPRCLPSSAHLLLRRIACWRKHSHCPLWPQQSPSL